MLRGPLGRTAAFCAAISVAGDTAIRTSDDTAVGGAAACCVAAGGVAAGAVGVGGAATDSAAG